MKGNNKMKAKQREMALRMAMGAMRMKESYRELYAEGVQLIKDIEATRPTPEQVAELKAKIDVAMEMPELGTPDSSQVQEYGEELASLIVRHAWLQERLDTMARTNQVFKDYLTPRYSVAVHTGGKP